MLSFSRRKLLAANLVDRLGVKLKVESAPVRHLSGGNQQKIALGKWLARKPSVLLLDEPTRGIDIGSKAEIHRIILELAAAGVAVVIASSEMRESLALSDRILVMCEGRVRGELSGVAKPGGNSAPGYPRGGARSQGAYAF